MRKHLKVFHTARKCMWCDDAIYEHWDTARINRHVREKHKDEVMEALGVSKAAIRRFDNDGTISIPLRRIKKQFRRSTLALASEHAACETNNSSELQSVKAWGFCDRCGRDGNYYSNIERAYHGSHCEPGIFNGANCKFCTVCGKPAWLTAGDTHKSGKSDGQLSHCSHKVDDTNGPHCSRCGFNTSRLPQNGRDQHQQRCKGFSALSGRFCIYCGEEFRNTETQVDWDRNKAHMVACFKRNPSAVGVLEEPEMAAFNQQQNNLRLQIKTATIVPEEERGQNGRDGDLNYDNGKESSQAELLTGTKATMPDQVMADSSTENVSTAPQEIVQDTASDADASQLPIFSPISERPSQETLRTVPCENIPDNSHGEPSPKLSTEAPDNTSQQRSLSLSPSRQPSPVPIAKENEMEPVLENRAESPLFVSSSSSEAGSDAGSVFGEDNEEEAHHSADGVSEDELLSDPSKSKRRKPRGRKRGRDGDRNYQFESDDDDDDSETDEEAQSSKPPRRSPSPNWNKLLGEDEDFIPSDEFYCSKCFRKAPKNHKRDRSPLGRMKEIEV
jgi:hypothetical protein